MRRGPRPGDAGTTDRTAAAPSPRPRPHRVDHLPGRAAYLAQAVIGRQSVHDRRHEVVGYELRLADVGRAAVVSPEHQLGHLVRTDAVLDVTDSRLERLVGPRRIFCDADRRLLTDPALRPAEAGRYVLEVGRDIELDAEVLAGCRRLAAAGVAVAIDHLPRRDDLDALLPIASIVKVDAQGLDDAALEQLVQRCRAYGVQLAAYGIESSLDLARASGAGFDLFQGGAVQPRPTRSVRQLEPGSLRRLQVAAGGLGQVLDFEQIEEILRGEPVLTYQVLQLASAGGRGSLRRQVRTVREALVRAGSWRVQGWIAMLSATPGAGTPDDAVVAALTRARACEVLAHHVGEPAPHGFAAGMVASFEQLLQISSHELLANLPLAEALRADAFTDTTPLGRVVCDVSDHLLGRRHPRMLSGVSADDLDVAMAAALGWAVDLGQSLSAV